MRYEDGQATVEYVVVFAALIAVVAACGALWRFGSNGGFSSAAQTDASHVVEQPDGVLDVLLY